MAVTIVPESNVAGAPSAPLGVEPMAGSPEARVRAITQELVEQGIPREEAVQIAMQRSGYADQVRQRLKDELDARMASAQPAPPAAQPEPEPDMTGVDTLPGDRSGRTQRVWNPQTRTYDTVPVRRVDPQAAQRQADDARTMDRISTHYGPAEAARWQEANNQGRLYVPQTRQQVMQNAVANAATYAAMEGNETARKYLRDRDARVAETYRPQWIREAGLDPDSTDAQTLSNYDLAQRAKAARSSAKQAKEMQWRVQMMMNAGNFAGAMALAGNDPNMASLIMNQQNAALNARRPGGPIQFGPNPLGVQAAHNQQLTELGLRVATGRGFQPMTPAQEAAANAQAQSLENQLPADQQAQRHVKDPVIHPSEYQYADDYVTRLYSDEMGWLGTSSDFTIAEQQQAVDHLVKDKGYSQDKAQKIVDEIARRRNAQSWGGSSMRGAPAAPPNPTGGAI